MAVRGFREEETPIFSAEANRMKLRGLFAAAASTLAEVDSDHADVFKNLTIAIERQEIAVITSIEKGSSHALPPLEFGFIESGGDVSTGVSVPIQRAQRNGLMPVFFVRDSEILDMYDAMQNTSDRMQYSANGIATDAAALDDSSLFHLELSNVNAAKLFLPIAVAATFLQTYAGDIPVEAMIAEEREPYLFDTMNSIYTYWGRRYNFTEEQVHAAIPIDLSGEADISFRDFIDGLATWELPFGANLDILYALKNQAIHLQGTNVPDKQILQNLIQRFIQLRATLVPQVYESSSIKNRSSSFGVLHLLTLITDALQGNV